MRHRKIWFKGAIMSVEKAAVSVLAPTAQFGLNVFEGIRCYWNSNDEQLYAFRLGDHLTRLIASCKVIGISSPYPAAELQRHFMDIIRANNYREDVAVRMTVFVDGDGSWSSVEPIEMFIAPIAKARTVIAQAPCLSACISTWERINDNSLPPRIKVGANYINGRYGHLEARRNGYDVPIFLGKDGKVTEGAGACLFMMRRGELVTPATTSSVLESITRATVQDLAADLGIPIRERVVDRTELYLADEVFLCGSAAEIQPIGSVDRHTVGTGAPGKTSLQLLAKYHDAVTNNLTKHREWCTPVYV